MDLRTVLNELLATESRRRDRGTTALQAFLSRQSAEVIASSLLSQISVSSPNTSSLALVLLKMHVIDAGLWKSVSRETKDAAKKDLLKLFLEDPEGSIKGLLTSTVVVMSEADGNLMEICDITESWLKEPIKRHSGLCLLESSLTSAQDKRGTQLFVGRLLPLLTRLMQSDDLPLRISACQSTVLLLTCADQWSPSDTEDIVKDILDVVTIALRNDHICSVKLLETIQRLASLSEKHPAVWRNHISTACTIMVTLANSCYFENDLRRAGLDFLHAVVTHSASLIIEHQGLVGDLLALSFSLIASLTPEADEYSSAGCDFLRALCIHLHSEASLSQTKELIFAGLHSQTWEQQVAALLAIAYSAEGFREQYEAPLGDILLYIAPFLSSNIPRVAAAGFSAIEALNQIFEPEIQTTHHAVILPLIQQGLASETVKLAADSLIAFCKGLLIDGTNTDFLAQYLPGLMDGLEQACKAAAPDSLTSLITAASVFATVLQADFSPYFPRFLTLIRSMLIGHKAIAQQPALRTTCITAIGNMVESVSEVDKMAGQAEEMLAYLIYLGSTAEPDDPVQFAIDDVYATFAALMKDSFAPYLKSIVTRLLEKVKSDDPQSSEFRNTFSDQRCNRALQALYSLLTFSDSYFSPMTPAAIDALIPSCRLTANPTLCKYAIKTVTKSIVVYAPTHFREGLLRMVLPSLLANVKGSSQLKYTKWLLRGVRNMFLSVEQPGVVGLPLAAECSSVLAGCLSTAVQHRHEISAYSDVILYVSEIVASLLRGFKLDYHSSFTQYFVTFFEYILLKPISLTEVRDVISVFCSYVEHTGDLMIVNSRSLVLEKFIASAHIANADVQRAALEGVTLCAKMATKEVFRVYVEQCRKVCEDVMAQPPPVCYTAVCTLGAIIMRHIPDMKEDWLKLLPLDSESDEAKSVHSFLLHNCNEFQTPSARVVEVLAILSPEQLFSEDADLLHSF